MSQMPSQRMPRPGVPAPLAEPSHEELLTHHAAALAQVDERFRLVVEAAPYGLLMVNTAGTITMVNPQCEIIFGFTQEELIGRSVEMLLPFPYLVRPTAAIS